MFCTVYLKLKKNNSTTSSLKAETNCEKSYSINTYERQELWKIGSNRGCLLLSIGVTSWGWLNIDGIFLCKEAQCLHGWVEDGFSSPHGSSNYLVGFFLFLDSWMPQISPSEHHIHSDLFFCQETGEKLIYWKENQQWLQTNSKPPSVVKGPVILVDFSLSDGKHAPHLSRCQRGSGATISLPLWLPRYYFGASFADQYIGFFLSNIAFECPTGWTLNCINLQWGLILESLVTVFPPSHMASEISSHWK